MALVVKWKMKFKALFSCVSSELYLLTLVQCVMLLTCGFVLTVMSTWSQPENEPQMLLLSQEDQLLQRQCINHLLPKTRLP